VKQQLDKKRGIIMTKIKVSFVPFKYYAKVFIFTGFSIGLFLIVFSTIQEVVKFGHIAQRVTGESGIIESFLILPLFFGVIGFVSALITYIPFNAVIKKINLELGFEFEEEI